MTFAMIHPYWFILPLVLVISLVYSASRHEAWQRIWYHFLRLCTWLVGILIVSLAVLLFINTQV
jgi:hypothetical protein